MSRPPLRVIKLGGSLLDWPPLAERFQTWLDGQEPASNLVIVGGGAVVDALRTWDESFAIEPEAMHWLAVRAMSLTAAMAAEVLPAARLIRSLDRAAASANASPWLQILEVESLLRADAGSADALPCAWQVTSDSIAARAATLLGSRELVLLKSTLPPGEPTLAAWSGLGFVDPFFVRAAADLPVRAVNLRSQDFSQLCANQVRDGAADAVVHQQSGPV